MIREVTEWVIDLVLLIFKSAWDFLVDIAIEIVDLIVSAFVALLAVIPIPEFMSDGLATVYASMDSGILYILDKVGVPAALAIIGAGYTFRFGRKILTLFQW